MAGTGNEANERLGSLSAVGIPIALLRFKRRKSNGRLSICRDPRQTAHAQGRAQADQHLSIQVLIGQVARAVQKADQRNGLAVDPIEQQMRKRPDPD
jgi:hypothetical protein